MTDLTDFLLARIAEDEVAAGQALPGSHLIAPGTPWDPARVLAECDAKRRIVDRAVESDHGFDRPEPWGFGVLRLLALPYADHPDYDETWRP